MGHYTFPIRAGSVNHIERSGNGLRFGMGLVVSSLDAIALTKRRDVIAAHNPSLGIRQVFDVIDRVPPRGIASAV
jgi:hypothetical protein